MRILVVEDDYISRRLLCRYLEPYGTCEEAVNGHEAVDAIRRAIGADEHYDLICLDIMMIMTSAMEDNQYIMQALNASADGYVVKPIEKRGFIETLKETGLLMETMAKPVGV
jgi:two-component system chemotaxis response regulator CheY